MRLLYLFSSLPINEVVDNWVKTGGYEIILEDDKLGRAKTELFEMDLLVIESEQSKEPEWVQEIRRAGRPIVLLAGKAEAGILAELEAALELARSNYQPIDCGYYDYFEAAIVQRRAVDLRYLLPDGTEKTEHTQLRDLKTAQSEEFVQLADGRWLRLDRIRELDGIVNTGEVCLIPPKS